MENVIKLYLPWSEQRYHLTHNGEVYDGENRLQKISRKNEAFVRLEWVNGMRDYTLAEIVVATYFLAKIPPSELYRAELLFNDGDGENFRLDNLAYRFRDGPIESEQFKGFYYVPYYTDYIVSLTGEVISLKVLRRKHIVQYKKWTVTKPNPEKNITGGYYCGRGKRDHDNVDGVSRHRFIALTFLKYKTDPLQLVVNHKNGRPGDDSVNNLEWVTYSENTKHAYDSDLHPLKTVKIVFLNMNLMVEKRYRTISDCCEENGFNFTFITARLKKQHIDYGDGLRFKFDDGEPWPVITGEGKPANPRTVMARSINSKEVYVFRSYIEAAEFTGVNPGTIGYHCKNELFAPTKGFNFRFASNDISWPSLTDYHLRVFERFKEGLIPRSIFLIDEKGRIVKLYEDAEDFLAEASISYSCLFKWIKNGVAWRGFKLRWFDSRVAL